ncbi:unnamed protein product [Cyclocybe aegerita]|uniref:Uncharacterized protein n=1 Tax=Cyclocybe aegerita TaxID=1973307 RepID=A0A8S0WHM6_CYCAE|nr:unnamed protein product [Cyclocybe aegerita]
MSRCRYGRSARRRQSLTTSTDVYAPPAATTTAWIIENGGISAVRVITTRVTLQHEHDTRRGRCENSPGSRLAAGGGARLMVEGLYSVRQTGGGAGPFPSKSRYMSGEVMMTSWARKCTGTSRTSSHSTLTAVSHRTSMRDWLSTGHIEDNQERRGTIGKGKDTTTTTTSDAAPPPNTG